MPKRSAVRIRYVLFSFDDGLLRIFGEMSPLCHAIEAIGRLLSVCLLHYNNGGGTRFSEVILFTTTTAKRNNTTTTTKSQA